MWGRAAPLQWLFESLLPGAGELRVRMVGAGPILLTTVVLQRRLFRDRQRGRVMLAMGGAAEERAFAI
jgi:hypothetical protein